jgi:hypothetical protein
MSKNEVFLAFFEAKMGCFLLFLAFLVQKMCLKRVETFCKLLVYSGNGFGCVIFCGDVFWVCHCTMVQRGCRA